MRHEQADLLCLAKDQMPRRGTWKNQLFDATLTIKGGNRDALTKPNDLIARVQGPMKCLMTVPPRMVFISGIPLCLA